MADADYFHTSSKKLPIFSPLLQRSLRPPTQMILPLKTFLVKQNLWSWFLDTSFPSPQLAGLLNKATFHFPKNKNKQTIKQTKTPVLSIGFQT